MMADEVESNVSASPSPVPATQEQTQQQEPTSRPHSSCSISAFYLLAASTKLLRFRLGKWEYSSHRYRTLISSKRKHSNTTCACAALPAFYISDRDFMTVRLVNIIVVAWDWLIYLRQRRR